MNEGLRAEAVHGPAHAAGNGVSLHDPLIDAVERVAAEAIDTSESPRLQAIIKAVKAWTDQLVDRSARNNLLFFRDQRTGTVDLSRVEQGPVFNVLAGQSRRIAQLVGADHDARDDA